MDLKPDIDLMEDKLFYAIGALGFVVTVLFGALSTVVGLFWKQVQQRQVLTQEKLDECDKDRKSLHGKNDRLERELQNLKTDFEVHKARCELNCPRMHDIDS